MRNKSDESESIKCLHKPLKIDPIISGIHNKNLEIVTLFSKNVAKYSETLPYTRFMLKNVVIG